MVQPLTYLKETASQTAGPYVHIGLAPGAAGFKIFDQELGHDIAGPNAAGERIVVEGLVIDGTGAPLKDVLIEVWQANAAGAYPHPADKRSGEVEEGFRGWGRVISNFDTGLWSFETVKPGETMPLKGKLTFGVYDPTMYAAMDFASDDDLVAVGDKFSACKRAVVRPDADEVLAQNQDSLTEAFFNDPAGTDMSKLFATRLEMTC